MDFPFSLNSSGTMQKLAFLVAGLLIGGTVVFLTSGSAFSTSGQQVGQELVSTLEGQSGQNLDLVSVKQVDGMYEVNIKTSNNKLATYYVTKNGKKFTSTVTDIDDLQQFVTARNQFSSCLAEKNVTLYGNASQRTTKAQIQILGGAQVVRPIYRDVSNPKVLRQAIQRGVRRIPATYYNGSVKQGAIQLQEFQEFTGCTFKLGQ